MSTNTTSTATTKPKRGRPVEPLTPKQQKAADRLAEAVEGVTEAKKALDKALAAQDREMAKTYGAGVGSTRIGQIVGLTGSAVLNRLRSAGVEIRR